MRWRERAATALLCGCVVGLGWACTDSTGVKLGKGDEVFHDVDATIIPDPPQPDAGDYDSPFGPVNDAYPAYSYSPPEVCKKCGCEGGTYCFGGATGYTTFSGSCTGTGGLAVGCQPIPAACEADASCDCLFDALKSQVGCYLNCEPATRTVFCPSP